MTLRQLADGYLQAKAEQGRKPATLATLRWVLSVFLEREGEAGPVSHLRSRAFLEHRFFLQSRLAESTLAEHMRQLSNWLWWANEQGFLLRSLTLPRLSSAARPMGWTPSERDTQQLLQLPGSDKLGRRDQVLLELLYGTGLRRSEAAALLVQDLDRERRGLWVRAGKGQKDRFAPIGDRLLGTLSEYLAEVRPQLRPKPEVEALFLTRSGRPLRSHQVACVVRNYGRRCHQKWTCHALRRAFATHLLQNGAQLEHLQQLLGHDQLRTTERYTEIEVHELVRVYQRTHPRARRRGG